MSELKVAHDLSLPLSAVTQTFAFLARKGAGKTYAATKLAELMLEAGAQIVALDPVGVWYGLRLAVDGKGAGFPIPVFGGLHGDLPLRPDAGVMIADLVVDRHISAVLDVSLFRKNERKQFVTDFAEQLFQRKKSRRTAIHFFLEEAQVFVPERGGRDTARMLGAFEDIVRIGRNYGIGCSMISQRPQSINKEVLNLTECLFALQTGGPHERAAIERWIQEKGVVDDIRAELPKLDVGEARVWSPQWLRVSKTVRVLRKKTYDASATPEVGAEAERPRVLAPVDVEELREQLREVIAEAEKNDPRALQAHIRKLELELRHARAEAPRAGPIEVPVITGEQMAAFEELVARLEALKPTAEMLRDALAGADEIRAFVLEGVRRLKEAGGAPRAAPRLLAHADAAADLKMPAVRLEAPAARRPAGGDLDGALSPTAQAFLDALNCYEHRTRTQLALITGYSPTSGGVNKALAQLRQREYVSGPESRLSITAEGRRHAKPAVLRRGPDLLSYWAGHKALGPTAACFLSTLYERRRAMSRAELCQACGYSATSGGVNKALALLRRLELVGGPESALSIAEDFYA